MHCMLRLHTYMGGKKNIYVMICAGEKERYV
jgi:hypothetical protein